jgi:hypothetical protein
MRYIKRFNESHIDTNEIKSYISDILSELEEFDIRVQSCKDIGDIYFNVVKKHLEHIHQTSGSYRYFDGEINEIIEINISKRDNVSLTYKNTKEQSESLISYMLSEGFDYIIDPVWKNSVGIGYKVNNISEIENKELISLNFRFFQ